MTSWGIYIHSPFCRYKCTYCDFDAGVYPSRLIREYVNALCDEIREQSKFHFGKEDVADSIYFGGGTPSLFSITDLERIWLALSSALHIAPDAECTIETIPEVIDRDKARALRRLGFNRVSIGAETFNENQLRILGRTHSARSIADACSTLRETGHSNINLDLIIGLPGQRLDDWTENLNAAFALAPEHISMYLLEVHEETKLGQLVAQELVTLPEDELVADMYGCLQNRAAEMGYEQYEISNFARPGYASRHNLKYWSDQAYLGFGSSAHSYNFLERWKNISTPERYINSMRSSGQAVESRWPIEGPSRFREAIFLGLRRTRGIDLAEFASRFGMDPSDTFEVQFKELLAHGLVERSNNHLRLTARGMLLSNEVFVHFV